MSNSEKKPIYKKVWFWIIVIVIVGAIISSYEQNTTQNTDGKPIEYVSISVDELENVLKNNAAAAKEKYNKQYLEIKGRLGVIDADLKYIGIYSLTDSFDLTGIHCTIKNDEQKEIVKTLSTGDTITVKGKITNVGEVLGYYLDITEISK